MHGLVVVRSIAISLAIALLVSMGGVSTASAAGTFTAPVPTVKGTVKVGYKLTATPGTWKPAPASLKYQWLRSGTAIKGATASTYTLVGADLAKTITVKVTGTKTGYTTASKTSKPSIKVVPGTLTAPVPSISGTAKVGYRLTAAPGAWTSGTALKYQWLRSGAAISGATSSSYVLTASDRTKAISVRVTGTKAGYTTVTKTSKATAAAATGTLAAPVPKVTGTAAVGGKLTAVPGTWTSVTTLKYQWLRSGTAITGATSSTYTLTASDRTKVISVRVTGSKAGYTTISKTSTATAAVKTGALTAPVPKITGTATVGGKLTTVPGTWTSVTILKYQWLRSGTAITGATSSSYTLVAADLSKTISVRVTGSKSGYTTISKTSAATATVKAGSLTAPVPTITGQPTVNSKLTAVPGMWTTGTQLEYQWLRSGVAISGATASTYILATADVSKSISVKVTGTKSGFNAISKTSGATAAVKAGSLTAPVPTITGTPTLAGKLTAATGIWTTGTVLSYQWLRAGVAISGATSSTYTLTSDDVSKTISVKVTGTKSGYATVSKTSAATASVASGALTAPVPMISGQAHVGTTLTAVPGTWTSGTSLGYQWLRDGTAISGATMSTYLVRSGDVSAVLSVKVTGTKAGYTTVSKISGSTGPVTQVGVTTAPSSISQDTTWSTGTYLINENLTVNEGATLTILAGVKVKIIDYSWVGVIVDGGLVVKGTAAAPVVFTTIADDSVGGDTNGDGEDTTPEANAWDGITTGAAGAVLNLDHAEVRYSASGATSYYGSSTVAVTNSVVRDGGGLSLNAYGPVVVTGNQILNGTGIRVDQQGIPEAMENSTTTVSDNTVTKSDGDGIYVSSTVSDDLPTVVVQNNTITNSTGRALVIGYANLDPAKLMGNAGTGNKVNALALSGNLKADLTLPVAGLPIIIGDAYNESLKITTGITLIVNAGTVVKAEQTYWGSAQLTVNGALIVKGTAAAPVVFTSLLDDSIGGDSNGDATATRPAPGNWGGITTGAANSVLNLDHADIRYSATGVTGSYEPSSLNITNSVVRDGGGITLTPTGPVVVTGNQVLNGTGIHVDQQGIPEAMETSTTTVSNNTVTKSTGDGIYISSVISDDLPAVVVQNNSITNSAERALVISYASLEPAKFTGNTGTGNKINTLALSGKLKANLTLPVPGLPIMVGIDYYNESLEVTAGTTMTVNAGTVVKVETTSWYSSHVTVNGALVVKGTAAAPVVFTSIHDDTAGGDTNGDGTATKPAAGNWGGIATGANGAVLKLDHAEVRYSSWGISGSPSPSLAVKDSVVRDGGGITLTAAGPVAVTGSQVLNGTGIRVDQEGIPEAMETSTTTVSNNTVTKSTGDGIGVSSVFSDDLPAVVVQNNTITSSTERALVIASVGLEPAKFTGNTGTGNKINVLALSGKLTANLTLPVPGLPIMVGNDYGPSGWNDGLEVGAGVTLTVNAGTVVKVEKSRWHSTQLSVNGALIANGTSAAPVVFTSIHDDTAGGDTNGNGTATKPAAGDWEGIAVDVTGTLTATNTWVKYASTCVSAHGDSPSTFQGGFLNCGVAASSNGSLDARNSDWGSPSGPAPYGDGIPYDGEVSIFPWTGAPAPQTPVYTATTIPSHTRIVPPQYATSCTNAEWVFLGVRGSGEEGPGTTGNQFGSNYEHGGFGPTVNETLRGFTNEVGDKSKIFATSLFYPAAATNLLMKMSEFNPPEYMASVESGYVSLAAILEEINTFCPTRKIILSGYSQGAMVVHAALIHLDSINSPVLDQIAGTILVADPLRVKNTNATYNPRGAEYQLSGGFARSLVSWNMRKDIPEQLTSKTQNFCALYDPVCSFSGPLLLGEGGFSVHTSYAGDGFNAGTIAHIWATEE